GGASRRGVRRSRWVPRCRDVRARLHFSAVSFSAAGEKPDEPLALMLRPWHVRRTRVSLASMRRWSLFLVALAAVAGGCRGGKAEHAAGGAPRGGTLRIGVAVPGDPLATLEAARIEFSPAVTELLS